MDEYKDLEHIARTSTDDFYELLGITSLTTDEGDIKRAYRKASLKVHPDKNPDNADAANKFILLGIARSVLLDVALRAQYDGQRQRKRDQAAQFAQRSEKDRQLAEDLLRREREAVSLKRKRENELDEEEKWIQKVAEDNRRKLQEFREKRMKEEEARFKKPSPPPEVKRPEPGSTPDLDRTIRIRFVREGESADWGQDKVSRMFSKYGKVDIVVVGKEKKRKVEGTKQKQMTATIFITYTRLDHAYDAVADAKDDWPSLQSVEWASKAPEIGVNPDPAISSSELTMMRLKEAAKKEKAQKAEQAMKTGA